MIISVSHQKGGVGKSTVAYNLALELKKIKKVVVFDLDVQQTVSSYNNIRKEMDEEVLDIKVIETVEEFEKNFEPLDEDTIVIIDSGGFDSSLNRFAILVSDLLITPVSTDFTEILGLQKYEQILEELSEETDQKIITHVLFNKINPNQKKFEDIEQFINSSKYFNLMFSKLKRRVDFANSVAFGLSVIELNKKSEASKELKILTQEVITIGKING